jgi:hypothetical protein
MYTIGNAELEVSVLDPVADRERFGTRYCTGGYIFQVADARRGPLLSGPTYPDAFNWFDGQGIPDAFHLTPLPASTPGAPALVIGIGTCDTTANTVVEFTPWEVDAAAAQVVMRTAGELEGHGYRLERTVAVRGRTVHAGVRLANAGRTMVPLRWYPHPFYPQPDTDELCRFNVPVRLGETAGFEIAESGFLRRTGWPWTEGHIATLDHEAHAPLTVVQRHPLLGLVAATCSFVPAFLPVWGNPRTISWEPYLERTLHPGQELAWHVDYHF